MTSLQEIERILEEVNKMMIAVQDSVVKLNTDGWLENAGKKELREGMVYLMSESTLNRESARTSNDNFTELAERYDKLMTAHQNACAVLSDCYNVIDPIHRDLRKRVFPFHFTQTKKNKA